MFLTFLRKEDKMIKLPRNRIVILTAMGVTPSDCTKNYRVLRLGLNLPAGEEKGLCHETQTVHSGFQKIDSRATAQ